MKIIPLHDFRLAGVPNSPALDSTRIYTATPATNQPGHKEKGLVFVSFENDGDEPSILLSSEDYKEIHIPRKGTLARYIFDKLENEAGPFDVIAYELTNDGEGWSVNTPWKIATSASLPQVIEAAQGRWGVFKANYSARATVKGLSDIGEGDTFELESDFIPFLQIRPA